MHHKKKKKTIIQKYFSLFACFPDSQIHSLMVSNLKEDERGGLFPDDMNVSESTTADLQNSLHSAYNRWYSNFFIVENARPGFVSFSAEMSVSLLER